MFAGLVPCLTAGEKAVRGAADAAFAGWLDRTVSCLWTASCTDAMRACCTSGGSAPQVALDSAMLAADGRWPYPIEKTGSTHRLQVVSVSAFVPVRTCCESVLSLPV